MKLLKNSDKEMCKYLINDIELTLNIISEITDHKIVFDEDVKERCFYILIEDEVHTIYDYERDVCLLNNIDYSRMEALKDAKSYADEWYRTHCT